MLSTSDNSMSLLFLGVRLSKSNRRQPFCESVLEILANRSGLLPGPARAPKWPLMAMEKPQNSEKLSKDEAKWEKKTSILSGIYSNSLSGILSAIPSAIPSGILSRHIFWHFILQIFWHSIWHSVWHLFSHSTWHMFGSRRVPLHPELAKGSGPGVLHGIWSSRYGSDPLVPTITTSWQRSRRGEGGEGGEGGRAVAPLLKSWDPHLAGGEKHGNNRWKPWKHPLNPCQNRWTPCKNQLGIHGEILSHLRLSTSA